MQNPSTYQGRNGVGGWTAQVQFSPHPAIKDASSVPATGGMEIGGLLNTRHAAAANAQLRQQMHHPLQMNSESYAMNSHQAPPMNHPQSQRPAMQDSSSLSFHHNMQQTATSTQMYQSGFETPQQQNENSSAGNDFEPSESAKDDYNDYEPIRPSKGDSASKVFACSTCQKGFARRSDLARHERIHSGVRPHACDFAGCGKRFIQRSALTVHQRVHTGVKPHTCERCGKPFSDSSSLARHRRIHSGKRPYKCPFANCQKTFTRRTTLTRHQSNHQANLDKPSNDNTARHSASEASSRNSTASPADRTMSPSPGQELPPLTNMQRTGSDYGYLPHTSSLPPHMRSDFQPSNSPRSTPSMNTPSLSGFTSAPQSKPSPTSHPSASAYGPPQPLEPPANGTASGSASPHMGALTWGSPSHTTLHSPGSLGNFDYPDPGFGGPPLYYPGSSIRRPQSTEPEDYGIRPRGSHALQLAQQSNMHSALGNNMPPNLSSHMSSNMGPNMNNHMGSNVSNNMHTTMTSNIGHVPMTADWSSMPMHGIKQERFVM